MKSAQRPTHVAGKWDARDGSTHGPFRCRWFFSWSEFDNGLIVGFFAGYEGGGAFVEERFHARFSDDRLAEFVWNGRDHVSSTDRSSDAPPDDMARCQDAHFDVFLGWHDEAEWSRGYLCLAKGREYGLMRLPSSLLLEPARGDIFERIAAMSRRTGILSTF